MNVERPGPDIAALFAVAPTVSAVRRASLTPTFERIAEERAGVVIATCHRVEVYVDGAHAGHLDAGGLEPVGGTDAARHLVSLAVGLESAVLAEDQILHQVRTSLAAARRSGPIGGDLDAVFAAALRAGRSARSWRPDRPGSLADPALDWIEGSSGPIAGTRILVVGAGEMGALAANAARGRGARVAIASSSDVHAAALAASLGSDAWPTDPGPLVREVAAIVVALGGPWAISDETTAAVADVRAVVDLSMPTALPTDLVARLGGRFRDVDAFGQTHISPDSPTQARFRHRLEDLRDRTIAGLLDRLESRRRAALTVVLADRIERERSAELAAFWRRLPGLDDDHRDAIEGMTRHLAERLFRDPLARLSVDPDGRRERAARDLFGL